MGDAIIRSGDSSAVVAHAQMLDVAMRAAAALKNARGMIPESLKSEGEVLAVILAGQELGLPAMASLRGLQVVRGKVIISYDTMIALLRRAGYRISWLESTSTKATLRLTAPDGEQHVETWDQDRAKRAGLWGKGTWSQYSETMLKARCVSSAARAFAAEVLAGVYVEGEIEQPAPGSSGSVEVRDLGAALHEADEPTSPEDAFAVAMDDLRRIVEEDDLWAWIRENGAAFAKLPDSTRKREQWKAITQHGKKVTPPMTVEAVRDAFRRKGVRPTPQPRASIEDDRKGALDYAMGELESVETNEALSSWANDNRVALAALEVGSSQEREVFAVIKAHCEGRGLDSMLVEQAIA